MKNIEGLYTALNAIIKSKEEEERLAIDVQTLVEEVKEEVDVHSASLDWYIQFALKSAAEVALWQNGYRSVVKGNGLFINADHCTNKAYISRLFNNAKLSELQKKRITDYLTKKITELGFNGQLSFDFETGTIVEDITTAELLEMLMKDANEDSDV